jgi:thiol-disulfide isomerase/thioredoxin
LSAISNPISSANTVPRLIHSLIPLLPFSATLLLLWQLPGVADALGLPRCSVCVKVGPPTPTLAGAAYFSALAAYTWCRPKDFTRVVSTVGLLFALALPFIMSAKFGPPCATCWIGHGLHVLFWVALLILPGRKTDASAPVGLTLALVFACGMSGAAIVGSLAALFLRVPQQQSTRAEPLREGTRAPTLTLTDMSGNLVLDPEMLAGSPGVILNFVTPDCNYCHAQLPMINRFRDEAERAGVSIVNVAVRPGGQITIREGESILQRAPDLPVALDPTQMITESMRVAAFPTTVFIGSDGIVKNVLQGLPPDLEGTLRKVVAQNASAP